MKPVQHGAGALSVLVLVVAASLYGTADLGPDVLIFCIIAAACLGAIASFKARRSVERNRVVAGCLVSVCAAAAAVVVAFYDGASPSSISALIILLSSGLALTVWSIRARNGASKPSWANYYDR